MQTLKACSLFIALMLVSGIALADTSYPGYSCLSRSDYLIRSGSKYESSDPGGFQVIACPVVRVTMPGGVAAGSRVFAFDQNPIVDVSCTLGTKNMDGTSSGFWFSNRTSSGSSSSVQILDFGALAGMTDGHFILNCVLPPESNGARSSIASYLIKN